MVMYIGGCQTSDWGVVLMEKLPHEAIVDTTASTVRKEQKRMYVGLTPFRGTEGLGDQRVEDILDTAGRSHHALQPTQHFHSGAPEAPVERAAWCHRQDGGRYSVRYRRELAQAP